MREVSEQKPDLSRSVITITAKHTVCLHSLINCVNCLCGLYNLIIKLTRREGRSIEKALQKGKVRTRESVERECHVQEMVR